MNNAILALTCIIGKIKVDWLPQDTNHYYWLGHNYLNRN